MKRPRVLRVIKCHFEMRLMTWASVEADLAKLMRALLVVSVLTARLVTVGQWGVENTRHISRLSICVVVAVIAFYDLKSKIANDRASSCSSSHDSAIKSPFQNKSIIQDHQHISARVWHSPQWQLSPVPQIPSRPSGLPLS